MQKYTAKKQDAQKEEGVDCKAMSNSLVLLIQVTRCEKEQFWKSLADRGEVSANSNVDDAADDLRRPIEAKAHRTSEVQRRQLLLALDATDTPKYAFKRVVSAFRARYGGCSPPGRR